MAAKHLPRRGSTRSRQQSIYQRGDPRANGGKASAKNSVDGQASVREEATPYDKESAEGSGHDTLGTKCPRGDQRQRRQSIRQISKTTTARSRAARQTQASRMKAHTGTARNSSKSERQEPQKTTTTQDSSVTPAGRRWHPRERS